MNIKIIALGKIKEKFLKDSTYRIILNGRLW